VRHPACARAEGGWPFGRRVEESVIERFLECGDPQHGFARIYCDQCRHACILPFSCKARYFCPSCHQKRVLAYGEWVESNVLAPVPHRRLDTETPEIAPREVDAREASRVRSTWARLIHKVYEMDPLECPRCKGPMRVTALIDDAAVIRKILSHLGLWAPQPAPRTLIGPSAHDPPGQSKPVLTYHPVPDIA
jgi:hypothetical protein